MANAFETAKPRQPGNPETRAPRLPKAPDLSRMHPRVHFALYDGTGLYVGSVIGPTLASSLHALSMLVRNTYGYHAKLRYTTPGEWAAQPPGEVPEPHIARTAVVDGLARDTDPPGQLAPLCTVVADWVYA